MRPRDLTSAAEQLSAQYGRHRRIRRSARWGSELGQSKREDRTRKTLFGWAGPGISNRAKIFWPTLFLTSTHRLDRKSAVTDEISPKTFSLLPLPDVALLLPHHRFFLLLTSICRHYRDSPDPAAPLTTCHFYVLLSTPSIDSSSRTVTLPHKSPPR